MRPTILMLLALFLAGCLEPPRIHENTTPVIKADVLDPADEQRVRCPEAVTRYEIGRYHELDGLMHEGHVVYRVTRAATWKEIPPYQPLAANAEVTVYVPVGYAPLPESQELQAELGAQRVVTARLLQMQAQMSELQRTAKKSYTTLVSEAEQAKALRVELEQARARVAQLEQTLSGDHPSAAPNTTP